MSQEYIAAQEHEHHQHSHEFHHEQAEHSHESHTCSTTCEHHHAAPHIDFMETVDKHSHNHEHGEDHVHGPGCGHIEYEQALFQVDQGKEKPHFNEPHEEHLHSPNCGHVEYQLAQTEIDKPHVHDDQCGHLNNHEAIEHVDHGKGQQHGQHTEHANHIHEKEHVHGPNCGHVEYEEAHKHVDKYVDEPATVETSVDHGSGDAETSSQSDNHHTEAATVARQVEETSAGSQQQAETNATAEESKAPTAIETFSDTDTSPEVKAVAPASPEVFDKSHSDEAKIVQLNEQAATDSDKIRTEDEPISPASETINQALPSEQAPIEILDSDAISPGNEPETIDLGGELDDGLQMEMPLTFGDEEPGLELASQFLSADESFETDHEILTDFAPIETADTYDSLYTPDAPAFDFTEGPPADTSIDFNTFEETPSLQLVEDSTLESLADMSDGDNVAEGLESMTNSTSGGSGFDLSDFGNGQMPEAYIVDWPALAKVGEDELESRLGTARAYIGSAIEQASEGDPADLEAMSDELLTMLQNMPKESAVELLPSLEELTVLYDLPEVEKLLELYFADQYQDQGMFGQLFVSSSQNDEGNSLIKFGEAVLRILERAGKKVRVEAA